MRSCNENIVEALKLVEEMLSLAEKGDLEREDVGCGVLYGIIRDSAYKIRKVAERERDGHRRKGAWDES